MAITLSRLDLFFPSYIGEPNVKTKFCKISYGSFSIFAGFQYGRMHLLKKVTHLIENNTFDENNDTSMEGNSRREKMNSKL